MIVTSPQKSGVKRAFEKLALSMRWIADYPVPRKQLNEILEESLTLSTTCEVYQRKDHPEDRVLAFQAIHPGTVQNRSTNDVGRIRHWLMPWR
ncbi:MAG: hypothetical protein QOJ15_1429 [Bradyrhizobium sp.]|jgi:hypothetical protein|nr:hypothetical protein [Bradyrhizobium sp.]